MLDWVDWTASMQQTFEYYTVDPTSWEEMERIDSVTSSSIERDLEAETLGSASFDIDQAIEECYIRVYLVITQNGQTGKECLGTFLTQTPTSDFDGAVKSVQIDAYTPLIELKENSPAIGYYIPEDANVMEYAYTLTNNYARAPVVAADDDTTFYKDFVADTSDTWLSYLTDVLDYADYEFYLDETSQILFAPVQQLSALQAVWEFNDDNSSILYPEIEVSHDLYGVPNVVEVIYSDDAITLYSCVKNEDEESMTSISSRGREVLYRETDPSFSGAPTQEMLDVYAEELLESLSTLEYTITYSHGYCPVRLGDCVLLNYERAGLENVRAKVTKQSITCEPGCPVSETAVFTKNLLEEY